MEVGPKSMKLRSFSVRVVGLAEGKGSDVGGRVESLGNSPTLWFRLLDC